jgi:hypothetical protein
MCMWKSRQLLEEQYSDLALESNVLGQKILFGQIPA